jgi:hypothetical protein
MTSFPRGFRLVAAKGLRTYDDRPRGLGCGAVFDHAVRMEPTWNPANEMPSQSAVQAIEKIGSAGRIRTYDQPVNSRLLYH